MIFFFFKLHFLFPSPSPTSCHSLLFLAESEASCVCWGEQSDRRPRWLSRVAALVSLAGVEVGQRRWECCLQLACGDDQSSYRWADTEHPLIRHVSTMPCSLKNVPQENRIWGILNFLSRTVIFKNICFKKVLLKYS